jgi:hypothetical protein
VRGSHGPPESAVFACVQPKSPNLAMNPWQALIASQTKPSRDEYAIARRVAGVVGPVCKVKPVISVEEWLRTLPPSESYQTPWNRRFVE